jgi:endonuclease YncB( thermonuclease family)
MTPRFNRFLIAALVTLVSSPALAGTITGQASVIDGDTLEIHEQRIRLSGTHPNLTNYVVATIACNIAAVQRLRTS